jgi:hypothetical protein
MHQQDRSLDGLPVSPDVNEITWKPVPGQEGYREHLITGGSFQSSRQNRTPCVPSRGAAGICVSKSTQVFYTTVVRAEIFGKNFALFAFLGPSSLQMNISADESILPATSTDAVGLVFRERMAGGFALGETDPLTGETKGLASNSFFDLRVSAVIPDLSGFLTGSEHAGVLTGFAHFAVLGSPLELHSGVIRLFHRTENPGLKLMEYRFSLRQGTRDYCLTGQKEIHKRRLLHSWSETTTLLCRLYEGSEARGAVIGAGVLHITLAEFLKQLSTFQVTNAPSSLAKAGALLRFGWFFAAELLDSYT